jgi:pimeloyl-ACP methyl ester carboxylesterase
MNRRSTQLLGVLASVLAASLVARAETALPPQGHLASVNGIQLYYEIHGDGAPLVMLHSFGASGTAWSPLVPEFAKTYRVILPDLRGHGRSTNPSGQFTHRQAALDIFALLDQMGVKSFKAIGASSGAMTLVHMATQQPARIEAMVLVGGTDQIGPEARALLRDPDCEKLTPEEWKAKREIHKHGDDQILALQRIFCASKDSYDDMNFTPPFLSTISAKTLIVHGDHDRFFPVRIPVEMYGAIPDAYLWIVPNGGHIPAYSPRHRDAFQRTALEFLSGAWEKKP